MGRGKHRGPKVFLSPEQTEALLDDIIAGMTSKQAEGKYGVKQGTVNAIKRARLEVTLTKKPVQLDLKLGGGYARRKVDD